MAKTISAAIKNRIQSHGPGWCFTPKHFLDLNSPMGVRRALSRLEGEKFIRRLAQGLYEYPRQHADLGVLPPQIEEIAKAIAEKNGIKVQPAGVYAANLVGFTEQVPAKAIFLTNGPSKKLKIGKLEVIFRTAREKSLHASGKVGLIVQALRNIGQNQVDAKVGHKIQRFLTGTSEEELKKNLKYASQWIRDLVFDLMGVMK
jgi:hypothetical protein